MAVLEKTFNECVGGQSVGYSTFQLLFSLVTSLKLSKRYGEYQTKSSKS
ncbi:hypothetical protein COLO4_31619 [Corchorus olitorius]|uniref:Uncharacterized protein n=1 Tax=Corchorus olitorius TaxID=93759 RepID=A0A1R3H3T3_9ROSI|nr:hypothetical protein COLO4_31619 [Corchorus olitorius]